MKPPEEIKKGLAACSADECHGQHEGCTYQDQFFCTMRMCGDALAYIQQLESRLAQVERERDAAVSELKIEEDCYNCKHNYDCKHDGHGYRKCSECGECPCSKCESGESQYEWRGVCAENTEEE